MTCDICGGTLVMQPGATAKCDCCGMDYSTESLRAKFVAMQTANNDQNESSVFNQNTTAYKKTNIGVNEYRDDATLIEPVDIMFEQQSVETDISYGKKLMSELSETEY